MLQDVTRLRANNKLKSYAAFFKIKVNSPDILGNLPSDNETKGSFSSKNGRGKTKTQSANEQARAWSTSGKSKRI